MKKQLLIKNLRNHTAENSEFSNKQNVVYLLVNIRKIIEIENNFSNYPALVTYCNLIVHDKLDRESSTSIISSSILPNIDLGGTKKEILAKIKEAAKDIFLFDKLKVDLRKFSRKYDLDIDFGTKNWKGFCNYFLQETENSEIEFESKIPIRITLEFENENRYKYAIYINNKRIGSEVLKFK